MTEHRREQLRAASQRYNERHRPAKPHKTPLTRAEIQRRHRARLTPEERHARWRRAHLWTNYRLRENDYAQRLEEQGGRCAICGRVPEGKPLAVDHDHKCCSGTRSCGACTRGLICGHCNSALGYINDDPAVAAGLAEYLLTWQ